MTVQRLRHEMSNAEFIDWQIYTRLKNKKQEQADRKAMQDAKRRH